MILCSYALTEFHSVYEQQINYDFVVIQCSYALRGLKASGLQVASRSLLSKPTKIGLSPSQ